MWPFIVGFLATIGGLVVAASLLLGVLVVTARWSLHHRNRIAPLIDDTDASGLLIEGPWRPARDAEGDR